MHKWVIASNNPGKIADYHALLSKAPIQLIPQSQFSMPTIEETGLSFVENALLKARHASVITNLPALGDDSGLVVEDLRRARPLFCKICRTVCY